MPPSVLSCHAISASLMLVGLESHGLPIIVDSYLPGRPAGSTGAREFSLAGLAFTIDGENRHPDSQSDFGRWQSKLNQLVSCLFPVQDAVFLSSATENASKIGAR